VGKIDPTGTISDKAVATVNTVGDTANNISDAGGTAMELVKHFGAGKMAAQAKWTMGWIENQSHIADLKLGNYALKMPELFKASRWTPWVNGMQKTGNFLAKYTGPVFAVWGGYQAYRAAQDINSGNGKRLQSGVLDMMSASATMFGGSTGFLASLSASAPAWFAGAAPVAASFSTGLMIGRAIDDKWHWSDRMSKWAFEKLNPNWREGRRGR
jgi:hypothetical protein